MSAENEQIFQLSDKCWLCDELHDVGDQSKRPLSYDRKI